MSIKIRIVPNDEPNAVGRWIEIDDKMPLTTSWRRACDQLAGYVPDGHHIVEMVEK